MGDLEKSIKKVLKEKLKNIAAGIKFHNKGIKGNCITIITATIIVYR